MAARLFGWAAKSDGAMRAGQIIWFGFLLVATEAAIAVPKLSLELALSREGYFVSGIAIVVSTLAVIVVWRCRSRLDDGLNALTRFSTQFSTGRWFLACLLTGVVLRIIWELLFPAPRRSDYATYFELAKSLSQRHSFIVSNTDYAYWPPGFPFFLAAFFWIFGVHDWIPFVANLVLFVATTGVTYLLAVKMGGATTARLATTLMVVWPTFVMSVGLASKELLILVLLPSALLSYRASLSEKREKTDLRWLVLTGLLLGFASLTQPSLLLLPSALFAYDVLRDQKWITAGLRVGAVVATMALVILPWTFRNHRVLGRWVPISTNGGDVFFRANSEKATGGYISATDPRLENLDEVQRSKLGFQLGEQWIRKHPGAFFALALRKEFLFLGDDAQGAYETLKRGLGLGGIPYVLLKGIANAFWWSVWLLILVRMLRIRPEAFFAQEDISLLMLSFLYLFCIHSIFESGGKYHVPMLAILAVVFSLVVCESQESGSARRAGAAVPGQAVGRGQRSPNATQASSAVPNLLDRVLTRIELRLKGCAES